MAHYRLQDLKHEKGHKFPEKADIVVVGAGMAGLYSTWRLLNDEKYKDKNIVILEKLDRTGGRLDSDLVHFEDEAGVKSTVKEEEGGMRFTFDDMDNLMALFMTLNQADSDELIAEQIVPFPMNSGGNNRLYFRGESFSQADAAADDHAIWSELYNLSQAEQGLAPSDMINTVYNRILAANPKFRSEYPDKKDRRGPDYWQAFRLECQWKGTIMKDWTLWDLFSDMGYSNEAITMLYRSSGFNGTFLSQMNGGVAYQLLKEFPAEPKFRTLADGFSVLPNALVSEIGKERIYLNTTVDKINKDGDNYAVHYVSEDQEGNQISGALKAEQVILGLPRLALEELFVKSNVFNLLESADAQELWNTLQTATNQPLLKINLYYDKAWWGNDILVGKGAIEYGPNFSDLPVGSVYPFYSVDDKVAAALEYEGYMKENKLEIPSTIQEDLDKINESKYFKPAALTIYCDYMNINYWWALQQTGELFTSPMQEEQNNRDPQVMYAASKEVVKMATEYFKKIFNTTYVPQPVLTSARIWAGSTRFGQEDSERFGFGVHQWALHAQDDEVQQTLAQPIENLFTCGEAFSNYQGWVEGALLSANIMLEKGWGLKPIDEVYEEENGQKPDDAVKNYYAENSYKMIRKHIDSKFEPVKKKTLADSAFAGAKARQKNGHDYGISLTNFDEKEQLS